MDVVQAILDYIAQNPQDFLDKLRVQLQLSGLAFFIAMLLGVPLGIWSAKKAYIAPWIIQSSNAVRVIPSLAVLAMMIPYIGTGFLPTLVALIILATPTLLINTYAGFSMVSDDVKESALGMGMTPWHILWKIELPLSISVILSGSKIAAVQVIAASTLAAFIGGGGLGEYILIGVGMNRLDYILMGAIPIALLSIIAEYVLERLEARFIIE